MANETKEQITKDQHYVPQFYLRRFVRSDGKLEILDCERRQISSSRTPKSVCNEEYYYSVRNELDEVSQDIEKKLGRIEDKVSESYDKIADKIRNSQQIMNADKSIISSFISLQYLRGPYMRKQIERMNEKVVKEMIKMRMHMMPDNGFFHEYEKDTGQIITEKQRAVIIEMVDKEEYRVTTNNAPHLQMMGGMEKFHNLLFAKEWMIYISKSSKKFITSDNPVLELFPDWTGKFFYGPDFLQRAHQFAMAPDIMIVATDPRNPPQIGKIKRKTLFDNSNDNAKILELNIQYARHATEFAYANNIQSLQDIIYTANLYDKQQRKRLLGI